eukprot:scaffold165_cov106-Skeletonema_dohrnii-CCMP3373.AAC.13
MMSGELKKVKGGDIQGAALQHPIIFMHLVHMRRNWYKSNMLKRQHKDEKSAYLRFVKCANVLTQLSKESQN